MTLTQQEQAYLNNLLEESQWKHVFYYGGNNVIEPCKRVKNHKKTYENIFYGRYGGKMLQAYQAAFIDHTQQIPSGDMDISHICGKNSCIELTHMILEPHIDNMKRWNCHNILLTWEKQHKNSVNLGLVFITDIPDKTRDEKAKEKGLWRSKRTRNKKQIKYHKCGHEKDGKHTCFINCIKH